MPKVQMWVSILVNTTNCVALLISFLERDVVPAAVVYLSHSISSGDEGSHQSTSHCNWKVRGYRGAAHFNQSASTNKHQMCHWCLEWTSEICLSVRPAKQWHCNSAECLIMSECVICKTGWTLTLVGLLLYILNFNVWLFFTDYINYS